MTNKISKITKRDIFDIFKDGIDIPDLWDTKKVNYYYYGRLEETDFLKRLYNLADIKLNGLALKLDNGKITNTYDLPISGVALDPIEEAGLKELLQEAAKYYDDGNMKIAVEKL